MKFFKKIISLYRIVLLIPKQINELRKQINELRKLNYSLIELNQKLIFEYYKNDKSPNSLKEKGFRIHSSSKKTAYYCLYSVK
jgi:hypothetical protein